MHYHVDLLGTGAFVVAALASQPTALAGAAAQQRINWSTTAVVWWSAKLAAFLLYRVANTGHDS